MRILKTTAAALLLILLLVCLLVGQDVKAPISEPAADGMFIYITAGPDQPHRVLMALQMAALISDSLEVAVYCDIDAVKWLTQDAPDLEFSHFPSSHTQIATLVERGVPVMACPGCLKAAGLTAEQLMPGVMVADKALFFGFTKGRILTLDY